MTTQPATCRRTFRSPKSGVAGRRSFTATFMNILRSESQRADKSRDSRTLRAVAAHACPPQASSAALGLHVELPASEPPAGRPLTKKAPLAQHTHRVTTRAHGARHVDVGARAGRPPAAAVAGGAAGVVAAAPATAATAAAPRLVRAGGLHAPTRWVPAARVADRGPEGQRSARGAAQRLAAAQQLQLPPARGRLPVRPKPALHTRHMGFTWASRCSRDIIGGAEALGRCSSCA